MKLLIVYATREGQTKKIAFRLADHLRESGVEVEVHDARRPFSLDFRDFDHLVFGASMHAGGLEKEIRAFITRHQTAISARPRSFFLVLLSAATKDKSLRDEWLRDAEDKFKQQIPVVFPHFEMVAGALRYSQYPLPLKWVMQRIARQAGEGTDISRDYEYTDWDQVKTFAKTITSETTRGADP
jgi:menaquinone-dependent protoporphyrinogen oxidase